MLAAKDERHAVGATLFFNAAHYALRPWPWILVGLCSLIVFPDLPSLAARFPHIPADKVGHDLAYPAMLTYLPHGLLGLVLASLIAAYMSTISTHLNWGSSYVVNDFYKRFINPAAEEKDMVRVGRLSTVGMMILMALVALALTNAKQSFHIMVQIGAGTGLLFILRWFWWRINAWSEISAMVISFVVAVAFELVLPKMLPPGHALLVWKFPIGVAVTTAGWIAVTFLTPPTAEATLRAFCRLAKPGGPGWRGVAARAAADGEPIEAEGDRWNVPLGLLCMLVGCLFVYATLFATGFFLYGRGTPGLVLAAIAAGSAGFLVKMFKRVSSG
jgi:Na+/proline symporter